MSFGVGMPSRDFTSDDLFSSQDDVLAQLNAFVANEHGRTGNQLAHLVLVLAAERAVERILRIAAGDLAHPCFPLKRPAGRSNEPFIAHRPASPSAQRWCRASDNGVGKRGLIRSTDRSLSCNL